MFRVGDKVICISKSLMDKYGFKPDQIYEVNHTHKHKGKNIITIRHQPYKNVLDADYAFYISNFRLANDNDFLLLSRIQKINKIKERIWSKE